MQAREAFHQNWTGLFDLLPSYTQGARCWREPGAMIGISGWAIAAFNAVIFDDPSLRPRDQLERLVNMFNLLGLPYSFSLCCDIHIPEFEAQLRTFGFSRWFADPLMYRAGQLAASADPKIVIQPVRTLDTFETYCNIVERVFDLPPIVGDQYLKTMWQMPQAHQVIAYYEEKPVGVGMLLCCNGTAGIYELGTLAQARRRGIGTTLCIALHELALELGYPGTVLAASAMGLSVYEKLGYRHDGYQIAYSR
jgi:GNAT superfamily N-acetyltransferase